ncbi:MAG: YdcF family protein [Gallionella sp.]
MSWLITNFLAAFLLPPLSLLLLLALVIFYFNRRRKLAYAALIALFILLGLASTPYIAEAALHTLEARSKALHSPITAADAIVVIGGGSYAHAPEFGGASTVNEYSLQRVRYGAKLYRATGKPILVSGGKPTGSATGEASQMRNALEQEFLVPVRWIEDNSDNTYENARNSYQILHPLGIDKIYLVTHAWHMPRAAQAFREAGFTVIEAPTAYTTRERMDILAFVPRVESLRDSKIYIHEMVGLLWYRIKS